MFRVKHTKITPTIVELVKRCYSSALYLTGQNAQGVSAVVKPYLDFDERITNENLEENIQLRGLHINLKRLKNFWAMYKMIEEQKMVLQVTRTEIGKLITELMKDENKYKEEIAELKTKAKLVKNDYLNVRDYAVGLEETAADYILSLPNVLHQDTPKAEATLVHSYLQKPSGTSSVHLDIAKDNNLIEYINPTYYYLINDAALFESGLTNYAVHHISKLKYTQFSNTNFSRSVVVEGCGTDFTNNIKTFTIDDPHEDKNDMCRLHFTGGGSLYSFMAYFTKHSVQASYLPLRLFTCSKIYEPAKPGDKSLLNLAQRSALSLFIATDNEDASVNDMIKTVQNDIISHYENLGYHFRVIYVPVGELAKTESLRLSFQMYSNYLERYVEVGNITVYDSYLSKRLLFTYGDSKQRKFLKVMFGNVLDIQKVLACALENNSVEDKPLLNNLIKSFVA